MRLNEHGYWEGTDVGCEHAFDDRLAKALASFFIAEKASSVADLGCGLGEYVKLFKENGLNAVGYDGNPQTPALTNGLCEVLDLALPVAWATPVSWVMSLEVGEHLPQDFEDTFVANLHHNNQHGIVLSWAVESQGGYGHFNERSNAYIKSKICKLGYTNDVAAEEALREASTLWWFKNTIMVFRPSSSARERDATAMVP